VLGREAPRNRVDVLADASRDLVRFTRDPRAAPSRMGPRLPPGAAAFSPAVVRTAEALGEWVVLWSVDPTDWSPGVTARQIARRVLGAVRPGSIVILHDGGGDRSATIRALPVIVKGIRQRGLRLVEITAR